MSDNDIYADGVSDTPMDEIEKTRQDVMLAWLELMRRPVASRRAPDTTKDAPQSGNPKSRDVEYFRQTRAADKLADITPEVLADNAASAQPPVHIPTGDILAHRDATGPAVATKEALLTAIMNDIVAADIAAHRQGADNRR